MTHIWSLTHIHKSDQFLFTPQGQPLQIWCIWSYLIINIIIEIIITDQSSSMVTLQVQPPQRLCIWWSALERSHQALLDTCLLSGPALLVLMCYLQNCLLYNAGLAPNWSMDNANNNHYHNNYLEHMEMGIHRDSDKGWDEVLVWSPSVRKPQLDENNVRFVRKPQMKEYVIILLLSIIKPARKARGPKGPARWER